MVKQTVEDTVEDTAEEAIVSVVNVVSAVCRSKPKDRS